jgi:hypothetical protein
MPLIVAFNSGNPDTSNAPSTPSGLGPRIRKATAAEIMREKI